NSPGLDPPRHLPARARALPVPAGGSAGFLPGAGVHAGSGATGVAGVLPAAAGGAGVLPGCGTFAVAGSLLAGTGGLGAAVLEQGVRGGQRAVLLDQLGDPGPGHAQPEADLGVGQALARLQAGLPQPGGAEDRR